MTKLILAVSLLILLIGSASCKKESDNNPNSSANEVQYEMTTVNPDKNVYVSYNSPSGLMMAGWYTSGWVYPFKPLQKPFTATLGAYVNGNNNGDPGKVTLKIYVNGTIVKQSTITLTNVLQQIQYVIN